MVPGEALFCFWWLRKTKWKGWVVIVFGLANLENLGDFRLQDSDIFHRHELRTILDLQCAGYCRFDNGDKDKM